MSNLKMTLLVVLFVVCNNLIWLFYNHNLILETKNFIRFQAIDSVFEYADKHGSVPCLTASSFVGIISNLTDLNGYDYAEDKWSEKKYKKGQTYKPSKYVKYFDQEVESTVRFCDECNSQNVVQEVKKGL